MPSSLDLNLGERLPRGVFTRSPVEGWRDFPCFLVVACFLCSGICTSCGAVGYDPPPPAAASVTVTPNSAQPFTGGNVQFQAIVQNSSSSAVVWQVNQTPGGNSMFGTISTTGYYSAPSQVPNTPAVTVTAVLQADTSVSGSALVTVQSLSGIQGLALSPALASVTTSQSLQLQVVPSGVNASDLKWAVDGIANGSAVVGTISLNGNYGVYSPPVAAGPHLITATLIANPGAVGSATVEVTDLAGTLTWRNDNSRSGINNKELALAPSIVSTSTFGKLFSCPIDGYAYAQPLYVPNLLIPGSGTHNVVFVATENDSVFAFDADSCVQLWRAHDSIIPPGSQPIETPDLVITTANITPFVGITGTPVIDLAASALYVVTATETMPSPSAQQPIYSHRLYALDLATGQPKILPAGVEIGTLAGQTSIFYPSLENQRPALLLDNGTVYIAFGSYGTPADSLGWLFGYDPSTLQQTRFFEVSPNTFGGGIWQSGGGPSADSNHDVFVVTGDGAFNADRGLQSYSDSFLRLGTAAGLTVADYFTPCDQALLESEEFDVGASAPVLLPESPSQTHLLIGGSKSGSLYVVNRDAMGGLCPNSTASVQTVKVPVVNGTILSTPLFWNNSVYVAPGNGNLMSFPMSAGILASAPSGPQSPETLGPQGATPVISSNGTSNAILWLIDTSGALATPNAPAILRAFDPNDLSNEIYHSTLAAGSRDKAGPAVKFTVPTVTNGKVYVGTQTELDVYGLLQ